MMLIGGTVLFLSLASAAQPQVASEYKNDAETIVVIDLKDLAPKGQGPRLPADYGQRVARALLQHKSELMSCLAADQVGALTTQVALGIHSHGRAELRGELSISNQDTAKCLKQKLEAVTFPPHPLKQAVGLQFPLVLERRSI